MGSDVVKQPNLKIAELHDAILKSFTDNLFEDGKKHEGVIVQLISEDIIDFVVHLKKQVDTIAKAMNTVEMNVNGIKLQ